MSNIKLKTDIPTNSNNNENISRLEDSTSPCDIDYISEIFDIKFNNDILLKKIAIQEKNINIIAGDCNLQSTNDFINIDFDDDTLLKYKVVKPENINISASACDIQSISDVLDINFDDNLLLNAMNFEEVESSNDMLNACACDCACG